VPSGASTGENEALELRDADGKRVSQAIKNINEIIAPKLKGKDVVNQTEIDKLMIGWMVRKINQSLELTQFWRCLWRLAELQPMPKKFRYTSTLQNYLDRRRDIRFRCQCLIF